MNRPNTEQSNDNDQNKPIVVDPLGQLQKGEVRKLDVTDPDDAWKRSAPLQGHRWYKFRLNPLAKDACSLVYLNPKNHKEGFYYTANLNWKLFLKIRNLKDNGSMRRFLLESVGVRKLALWLLSLSSLV